MASFFNLILDTTAPSGLIIKINGGASYTTNSAVTLALGVGDTDTTGYQMKIWGIDGVASESAASWETYASSKSVTLTSGDGLKTVYFKVRDDVGNESASASAQITLDSTLATVTITGPDKSKVSKVSGYNVINFSFTASEAFVEYKVCVVAATGAIHSAGTVIGTTGGSNNTSGTGSFSADTAINVSIYGSDLEAASSGDGTKIIKVFVKDVAGNWSVA